MKSIFIIVILLLISCSNETVNSKEEIDQKNKEDMKKKLEKEVDNKEIVEVNENLTPNNTEFLTIEKLSQENNLKSNQNEIVLSQEDPPNKSKEIQETKDSKNDVESIITKGTKDGIYSNINPDYRIKWKIPEFEGDLNFVSFELNDFLKEHENNLVRKINNLRINGEDNTDIFPFEMYGSYRIFDDHFRILSIKYDIIKNTGGITSESYSKVYNLDRINNNAISYNSLFPNTKNPKDYITNIVNKEIVKNQNLSYKNPNKINFYEDINYAFNDLIYYFKEKHMVIEISEGVIAPYKEGKIIFEIKYSEIKDDFNINYLDK